MDCIAINSILLWCWERVSFCTGQCGRRTLRKSIVVLDVAVYNIGGTEVGLPPCSYESARLLGCASLLEVWWAQDFQPPCKTAPVTDVVDFPAEGTFWFDPWRNFIMLPRMVVMNLTTCRCIFSIQLIPSWGVPLSCTILQNWLDQCKVSIALTLGRGVMELLTEESKHAVGLLGDICCMRVLLEVFWQKNAKGLCGLAGEWYVCTAEGVKNRMACI